MYSKDNPGPGAYMAETYKSLANQRNGFSLGKQDLRSKMPSNDVPGPGNYDLASIAIDKRGIRFGKSKRDGLEAKNDIPGPGFYNQELSPPKYKNAPAIKFGSAIPTNYDNDVPGPGNYEIVKTAIDNKGIKFGKDDRIKLKENDVPGPGNYAIRDDLLKTNKGNFKFGREERTHYSRIESPGPGNYDPVLPKSN